MGEVRTFVHTGESLDWDRGLETTTGQQKSSADAQGLNHNGGLPVA